MANVDASHVSMVLSELRRRANRRTPGDDPPWWSAADIACYLAAWDGKTRETQRRRVREVIDEIRREHPEVIASGGGYALAISVAEFDRYTEQRRRSGLHDLADASKIRRSPAFADATGQGAFFPV